MSFKSFISEMKIGPSKPFDHSPHHVDKWYDRRQKSWVVQLKNKDGDQLGDAVYVYSRNEADKEASRLKDEHKLTESSINEIAQIVPGSAVANNLKANIKDGVKEFKKAMRKEPK